jgi:hypothetical protein
MVTVVPTNEVDGDTLSVVVLGSTPALAVGA